MGKKETAESTRGKHIQMGTKTIAKPRYNPCKAAYNPPITQQQRSTRQTWPKRQHTQKWIPMDALTKQGYFAGAYYIWIPKNKKSQVVLELPKDNLDRQTANGQTKLKWMPTGRHAKQATEPKIEIPRQLNKMAKIEKKATALEKGKWVPKVVCNTTDCHNEQLPSTSSNNTADTPTNTTATQRLN